MVGEIINEKVLEGASETVESLLRAYKPKLNEALLKEDPLTVALSMKFRCTDGDVVVETNMNFVLDRIKTSASRRIQEDLPLEVEAKKKGGGVLYVHRERGNIPTRWWKNKASPDCRIDAERLRVV